eukprot:m.9265 g.9265  ORF g.9265 m.9265 type:complete len:127 (-) comp2382_c0_seq1:1067-1447(-)
MGILAMPEHAAIMKHAKDVRHSSSRAVHKPKVSGQSMTGPSGAVHEQQGVRTQQSAGRPSGAVHELRGKLVDRTAQNILTEASKVSPKIPQALMARGHLHKVELVQDVIDLDMASSEHHAGMVLPG